MTSLFKKHHVEYFPCNAGLFILAKIVPHGGTWEKELEIVGLFRKHGVLVGPGRRYHVREPGWARISFAMEKEVLDMAIERMERVFQLTSIGIEVVA